MGNLLFNGISTLDMGVQIQSPPSHEFPNRRYNTITIDGKNGIFVIDKKSYENVERSYVLTAPFGENGNLSSISKMILDWLLAPKGYARLEDSYEPEYYRMAFFENNGQLPNMVDMATGLEVIFNCKPQRYLKDGEKTITIDTLDTWMRIINPTNYEALPEITLQGSSDLEVIFLKGDNYDTGVETSSFTSSYTSEFIIDSELQECYNSVEYVNNSVILTNEFPKLYPGVNWIKITGSSLTKFNIKPRWWTL